MSEAVGGEGTTVSSALTVPLNGVSAATALAAMLASDTAVATTIARNSGRRIFISVPPFARRIAANPLRRSSRLQHAGKCLVAPESAGVADDPLRRRYHCRECRSLHFEVARLQARCSGQTSGAVDRVAEIPRLVRPDSLAAVAAVDLPPADEKIELLAAISMRSSVIGGRRRHRSRCS